MSDDREVDWIETNRRHWDDRAGLHARLDSGYELRRYHDDPDLLSGVVEFDRRYLGDLTGRRVVHLQCHIGTDTLSLARLGADVTGLDQSGASIEAARELFAATDTDGRFVESGVYEAESALDGERFDLVYTGVGAINWLPDIARWALVVASLLRPGGMFYIREGHPMAMTVDDDPDAVTAHGLRLRYPYFELAEPLTIDADVTYVDTGDERLTSTRSHEWNHGLGEVFGALRSAGLDVVTLDEHRELEWHMIPGSVQDADGRWLLPEHQRDLCPMMYSIVAVAPG